MDRDLQPAELNWITAMRHATLRKLAPKKHIQPGLLDSHDTAAVASPDFPGERLLVCYKPLVAVKCRLKRQALLARSESDGLALAAGYAPGRYDCDEFNRLLGTLRRVRARLSVCLVAHCLEWHMRRRVAPLLFTEEGWLPLQSFPDPLARLAKLTSAKLVYELVPGNAVPALSRWSPGNEITANPGNCRS